MIYDFHSISKYLLNFQFSPFLANSVHFTMYTVQQMLRQRGVRSLALRVLLDCRVFAHRGLALRLELSIKKSLDTVSLESHFILTPRCPANDGVSSELNYFAKSHQMTHYLHQIGWRICGGSLEANKTSSAEILGFESGISHSDSATRQEYCVNMQKISGQREKKI